MSVVEESAEAGAEPKKEEAPSHFLRNPSRVLPAQSRFVSFTSDSRYKPVVQGLVHGIIVVADLRPGEDAQVLCALILSCFVSLTCVQVHRSYHRAARGRGGRGGARTASGAIPASLLFKMRLSNFCSRLSTWSRCGVSDDER